MTAIILAFLFLQALPGDFDKLRGEPDGQRRTAMVEALLKRFDRRMLADLVALAEKDPEPAVRRVIVERLGRLPDPAILELLNRRASSDPDAGVSLLAMERLREQQARHLGQLFEKRLALARAQGDEAGIARLAAEHQRWVSFSRGAILPAFLQAAPPVFEAIPAAPSLRVLAFGDFGIEGPNQRKVAAAAAAYHRAHPFDIGLTAGDNFLFEGVTSPEDPRWKAGWEDLYGPLGIPFFATLGNHDWGYADSPAAEMLHAHQSRSWHMPATHYSFLAGPVQFFALATDALSETQLRWLDQELRGSRARWKIVYGHEPIYSHGQYGATPQFERILMPILQNRADVYLSGHEHDMQHLKPEAGVHFIIAGGGGASIRPVKPGPRTLFDDSSFGFAVLDATTDTLKLTFVDADGKIRYETRLK